ncbi:pyruvate, phosphate dikinase [Psychromonas sp. MB-3u-54]|uniref:pyruvate, phosphate dikinase n=1 Tax=Psychromonas sp. MB-3u-54 TaxID=2058319 RepID=UPI0018E29988|nr:pyruvate, phosphate dikinase [Psychromonas sp. MB-3u-54]
MAKYVYLFTKGQADGDRSQRELLGGKGANLAEMAAIGMPVPSGFTLTTEVCKSFYQHDRHYPEGVESQVNGALKKLEQQMAKGFGDPVNPLLLSVRSGAPTSMPGMMDTVLNLGLNDQTVQGLINLSGDPRFAYDSYRRFIQMYANVVKGVDGDVFEKLLEDKKRAKDIQNDNELSAEDLQQLIAAFKASYRQVLGLDFPTDPQQQLWEAISAVFGSWMNQRAVTYRRLNNIPSHWGTAVNVQAMVFGNMGNDCATGVAFTRDPSTGENYFYGEFLVNAQGEDVVAGIRTPQPINKAKYKPGDLPALEDVLPACYAQLLDHRNTLEKHFRDMQDLEFTIESGKLYMLQTRTGKRTAQAAIRIAVEMVAEKLIDKREAVLRVLPEQLEQLLHPSIDPSVNKNIIAKGLPASPGACSGKVVFNADEAEQQNRLKEKVILVRIETSPEDIHGMNAAQGILTSRGGMTSHAAVVARGMGKSCVAGCGDLHIDYEKQVMVTKSGHTIKRGDIITLDGAAGEVILGDVPKVQPAVSGDFGTLMSWADTFRTLQVRANADTPHDAKVAREFGAEGIGLCRTEHMFFDVKRIQAVREMIVSTDLEGRERALSKIMPMQKNDFIGLFREMRGVPVTIRLLDPPLHEFLPQNDDDIADLAALAGMRFSEVKAHVEELHEFNPMLGHRGCRLGLTYPEVYDMQVRAIMEAACELVKNEHYEIVPEIMIPLVADVNELKVLREKAVQVAEKVMAAYGVKVDYQIGTMIELPRAALLADLIALQADFFSFGTNDLTQTTYGLSRDDAGRFLPYYIENGLFLSDPFITLDRAGVGQLVKMGTEKGRQTRPGLKVGICGEHGGEPSSVEFCHQIGLDYVSCSPYRVPIARLAAAHAALINE